ncbi:N-acetyltransferase B complex non catalytic subunit-domain-containing protein [Coemansia spiralis]|nr:N-acetyltransferase B complex non catalytic subunit-domain-containing protein [Coemansia spiralis]
MEQRQLRPIYDALDISNVGLALQECNKLLRKHPNHLSAKALKAFALSRLGEADDALSLGRSVLQTPGSVKNPNVEQALVLAFRTLRKPEDEISVYNAILEHSPENESIHVKVFLAAACNALYNEQHKAAVDLNKLFKRSKYTWWIIISLLLSTRFLDDTASAQLHLALARKMAEKALSEQRPSTTEHLRIMLAISEEQRDYSAMLSALSSDGPLASQISNDPDLITLRISLFVKTRDYASAINAAIRALEVRDNWIDYKHYIDAVVAELGQLADKPAGQTTLLETTRGNFERWAQLRGRARSARLASVELTSKLQAAGYSPSFDSVVGSFGDLIWMYVDLFKDKAICYSDIMQHFARHVGDSASALDFHTAQLAQRIQLTHGDGAKQGQDVQSWVNMEKIRYLLQAMRNDSDAASWVQDISSMLEYGLDSKDAKAKHAAASDMVLLASQRLVLAAFLDYATYQKRNKLFYALFTALCILEEGIRLNANNFLLKLYAVRLYLYLSCYERARGIYDSLNIKNIQYDTLGHFIIGQGLALGCTTPDLELCYPAVTFYDRAKSKIPHEMESAYNKSTYSNILDFIEFKDNLKHSVQCEHTYRCALRLEILEQGCSKGAEQAWNNTSVSSINHTEESLARLHDNRDVNIMGLLTPLDMSKWNLEILTRPTPLPNHAWIRTFSLTPQVMHCLVNANAELLEAKRKELLVTIEDAGDSITPHDKLVARGLCVIATLYINAVDNKSTDEQVDELVKMIESNLPNEALDDSAVDLDTLPFVTIRAMAAATELFIYAATTKHALAAQRLSAAKQMGFELTQLRKRALRGITALRSWLSKSVRDAIAEALSSPEEPVHSGAIVEYVHRKHKGSVDVADGVYNYALMTVPELLFSADSSWFEPLPTDDIDVDLVHVMPLPDEEEHEIFEDTWGDLNKKKLLS